MLDLDPEAYFNDLKPALQLIDFGRCIDMKMYPKGKTFTHAFKKEEHKTPEMIDGKPWSYQLDHFNIASTAFVLLTGTYMKLTKNRDGQHFPQGSFKRYR